jgi:copper chaperone CopZ
MLKEQLVVDVDGIENEECVNKIKEAVRKVDGVLSVEIDFLNKKVYVEYDQIKTKGAYVIEAIEKAGFTIRY